MALFHIKIVLGKSLFLRIIGAQTSKEASKTLKDAYHSNVEIEVVKL